MKNRKSNFRLDRSGVVFVSVLVIMLVLFNLGLGYLVGARADLQVAQDSRKALKVLYHSESAIEHSIADIQNGGAGNIGSQDLDGDTVQDYTASYSMGTQEIMGFGGDGMGQSVNKTITVKVEVTPWTGALQTGTNISAGTSFPGSFNGNIDARGSISITGFTINGVVTPNNASLSFPSVSFPAYQSVATYSYPGNTTWNTNPLPGIHYIDGSLTIDAINNFSLNGSIVATGSVTFMSSLTGSITITPSGKNPAIITGTSVTLTGTPRLYISGLMFAETFISFGGVAGPSYINGGVVTKTGQLMISGVNNFNVVFDKNMNPPYFSGGGVGQVLISSWKPQ